MVFIQPTTYALINITDFPFFVVPLNEIEHVHFERVFSSSKTCDLKIIMKARAPTVLQRAVLCDGGWLSRFFSKRCGGVRCGMM